MSGAPHPHHHPVRPGGEITRYVGHAPDDDVALLLAYRSAA